MEEWFHKRLTNEQFEQVLERTHWIPDKAFADICAKLMDENPPMPGRFPTINRIKEGWQVWRMEHPQEIVARQRIPCRDCLGGGFFWYEKLVKRDDKDAGQKYTFCVRCAACRNWEIDVGHLVFDLKSRRELEAAGLDVWPRLYPTYNTRPKPRPVKQVMDTVVKPMDAAMPAKDYSDMLRKHAKLKEQIDEIMKEE